eukprot:9499876-Pyramimonas_sp.AAC.4
MVCGSRRAERNPLQEHCAFLSSQRCLKTSRIGGRRRQCWKVYAVALPDPGPEACWSVCHLS